MLLFEKVDKNLIRAIVFDLDGTLLDTIEDLGDSVNFALQFYGLPGMDYSFYKKIVGKGAHNLCETSLNASITKKNISFDGSVSVENILTQFKKRYQEMLNSKTRPYSGIDEALDLLQSNDVILAVISNKPDRYTKELVLQHFPKIHFQYIIGDSEEFQKKPDPSSLLFIMDKIHVEPEQVLFIGDGETDMQTAIAANVTPIGVLWGFRTEEDLIMAGAKTLLKDPSDINLELIGQIRHEK